MNTKLKTIYGSVFALIAAFLFGLAPVLVRAETSADLGAGAGLHADSAGLTASTSAKAAARLSAAETRTKDRGDSEIERRITNLNQLSARVSEIKNLSDTNKSTVQATISAQVSALESLKTKIDADTDSATLKTDVQSITVSYRVYALLIPQVEIIVASDRIVTVAHSMQELGTKLQARISAAQTGGIDVTAAANAFTDYSAKVADAQVQAQAAVTAIASLQPDQGDKTKLAANTAALKDARAKVVAGQKDLRAAAQDAQVIIKNVKGKDGNKTATTTAEVNASSTVSH